MLSVSLSTESPHLHILFLSEDLGSGDEKVRKSDVKKFLTPGYSTSGHVELYTVSLESACCSLVHTHELYFNLCVFYRLVWRGECLGRRQPRFGQS